jgi:hypothetical protein
MWMCEYLLMNTEIVPYRFLIERHFTQLHYNLMIKPISLHIANNLLPCRIVSILDIYSFLNSMNKKSQILLTTRLCKTKQNTGYVDVKKEGMQLTGIVGDYSGYLQSHFS